MVRFQSLILFPKCTSESISLVLGGAIFLILQHTNDEVSSPRNILFAFGKRTSEEFLKVEIIPFITFQQFIYKIFENNFKDYEYFNKNETEI